MHRNVNGINGYQLICAMGVLALLVMVKAEASVGSDVESSIQGVQAQLIQWRRHFHQTPELSGQEKETARYITDRLKDFGLSVRTGVGGFGVVGLLDSGKPGPVGTSAVVNDAALTKRVGAGLISQP